MEKFRILFPQKCSVIGMIHVDALPGAPLFLGNFEKIVSKVLKEAEIYLNHDLNGIMLENMHDVPYIKSKHFGPEVTASMTRLSTELRKIVPATKPLGIQVLAGGNKEALAVAKACKLDFIRAEGFVFAHIGDEGYFESDAGKLLRYRKHIEAKDVLIFTDIKKKHSSHAITSDVSVAEAAKTAEYFLSDGVIITGSSTGIPPDENEYDLVRKVCHLPVLIGSGVTADNIKLFADADAVIVGSYFKQNGKWTESIDDGRIRKFMEKLKILKNEFI